VVAAYLAAPPSQLLLHDPAELTVIFTALLFVVMAASKHGASRDGRVPELLVGLGALAAVIVLVAERHVLWQGRVLGYAALLFAAAWCAQRIGGMSDAAPDDAKRRLRWYLGVCGLGTLTLGMVAEAWSLTVPARLGGDMPRPPAQGVLIIGVWLPAALAVVLIGWPVAKRLTKSSGTRFDASGQRRFRISHLLLTVVLTTGFGALALRPAGHPTLGWFLGLAVGLLVSLVWELVVRANVLVRGPGPVIWGFGLLLIVAGVRGAVVSPSQLHPGSAELTAGMLVWLGVWVERRVAREVLGLESGRAVRGRLQG
jgi:hypothetical protein